MPRRVHTVSLETLSVERGQVYALEDNAPVHNSIATSECSLELGLNRIPHLPLSPGLNPTEHIWRVLASQRAGLKPNNARDLWGCGTSGTPSRIRRSIASSAPCRHTLTPVVAIKIWLAYRLQGAHSLHAQAPLFAILVL